MVTYAQLSAIDPDEAITVASVFRSTAAAVADRHDEVLDVLSRLPGDWSGSASVVALNRLTDLRESLASTFPTLVGVDQALSEFGTAIADARSDLVATGPVSGGARSSRIVAALDAATRADTDAATRLGSALLGFDPAGPHAPAYVPVPGTDPADVTRWWFGLTGVEQRCVIERDAEAIDQLDGLPATVRDQAARIALRRQSAALRAQEIALGTATSRAASVEFATIHAELTGLRTVELRLDDPAATRAYLLDIDAPDNRAIVTVGDPDHARNVLTMVAGTGSGLADAKPSLAAIDNLEHRAATVAGPDDLATIAWLNYASPATLRAAMDRGAATSAVADLARFQDGLRTSRAAPPAHVTVLGYSYGATVVGTTAHLRPLSTDEIVFVGSPGTGVDRAAELGMAPGHVWATVARTDAIRTAIDPVRRLAGLFTGAGRPAMWFGTDPTDPSFGARVFGSDPGAWRHPIGTHQSYFDAGSMSLDNIARIAVGQEPNR